MFLSHKDNNGNVKLAKIVLLSKMSVLLLKSWIEAFCFILAISSGKVAAMPEHMQKANILVISWYNPNV